MASVQSQSASYSEGKPLLILGMHRSGTSMLARYLQDAGIYIGEDLIGPDKGNTRGHYEDRDLYEFHCRRLSRVCPSVWRLFDDGTLGLEDFSFEPTAEDYQEARQLLSRRSRPGWWGWKEPRTCLFLDFWRELLPEMRGVVIYRHPLEVHLSHLRRGLNRDLLLRPAQILKAYALYNRKLLEGIRREPERYLVIHVGAAFRADSPLSLLLARHLQMEESVLAGAGDFHGEEFHQSAITPSLEHLFTLVFPAAASAYRELDRIAALPAPNSSGYADPWAHLVETWLPLLENKPEALAEQVLPFLEVCVAGQEAICLAAWKRQMALDIVMQHTEYREWAEQSIASQEKYIQHQTQMLQVLQEEKDRLGGNIQAEIERTRKIWDELVMVGQDWHRKEEEIKRLRGELQSLQSECDHLRTLLEERDRRNERQSSSTLL